MSKWTYHWNMSFNPNLRKQTQKVVFSTKKVKATHPSVFFFYQHEFTTGNKKNKKDIHLASKHLRMAGTKSKTIKLNYISFEQTKTFY